MDRTRARPSSVATRLVWQSLTLEVINLSTPEQKIAIIGAGMMGHGIALNILKAGYRLRFFEHEGNQPVDDLLALGAQTESEMAALGQWADYIILCVTGTPEVQAVLYRHGLLPALGPGKVLIDCSTAIPSTTLEIAQDVQATGAGFIDAPMTRTPKEAHEGRLNLIVGATPALFEQVKPLLQSFSENITHAGPVGAGHQMKLVHNFVSLGFAAVLSEATACAKLAGIEPQVLLEILGKGGGDGVVFNRLKPYIETGDRSGFMFSLSNCAKDLTYYDTMALQLGAPHELAGAVAAVFCETAKENPNSPMPELIDLLVKRATA